jgi:purine-nucleoside phosphorylase
MDNSIKDTVNYLKAKGFDAPQIGIILGTGLGKLVDSVKIATTVSYTDIPGFPESTVESHAGRLIYGILGGKMVVVMQGRFHYYEGYSMQQITFPVRVMKMLGINTLLVSNAAGAINLKFKKGSLMSIQDHINLLANNPLIGKNDSSLGPRFPDMSKPYCPQLSEKLKSCAQKLQISLHEGVYASMQGPMLETAAEYRMLRILGADAVGMSTVPEVIVANHMGMKVAAISVLTDECDPDNLKPVELSEIIAVAQKAEKDLISLFYELLETL